jgi:CRISPR/Cas system CSM-associated protein Csm3 (group 7 of RAMP superfamily)
MSNENRIKGKILLKGQIECVSPIHVGSGGESRSDSDILLDPDGNPFIPATSFVGILRHAFERDFPERFERYFWGYTEGQDGQQSALCCSDLTYVSEETAEIVIRDGVRIDNATGLAKNQGKFDFELVERGSRFSFNLELTYREADEVLVKQTARTIYDLLAKQRIQIGAKTNSGFGQIHLCEADTKIYVFDFSRKSDVLRWLTKDFSPENVKSVEELGEPFDFREKRFRITATLRLKSSLIVRSYSHTPEMPDTTQLKSRDDWVIPGSSLKGAIRARAERILNTLELANGDEIITELFGNVEDEQRGKNAKKGRIRVREVNLTADDFSTELQTRIKVDRFTGGVIEGGLFDSMPVFAPAEGGLVKLHIDLFDYQPHEPGLLLLVFKDLWSGDLAIGGEKNIGRGVFEGVRAEIAWDDEQITLETDLSQLTADEREKLEAFVSALVRRQA